MTYARKILELAGIAALGSGICALPQARPSSAPAVWVASWGASQQIPEPQNALAADDLTDATVRQIFHLSVGGPAVRVHISNAFGTDTLRVTSVHIARPVSPSSPAIDPAERSATDICMEVAKR